MPSLSLAIVGADYPNKRGPGRRFDLAICVPGEPIELRPEDSNPADEWAIAVYSCRGVQLGYIPSQRAPLVRKWMSESREMTAVFQARSAFGGWLRLGLDGEVPVVDLNPPEPDAQQTVRDGADPDFEFQPDPTWDE
jgi:hypothetical protein